MTIAITDKFTDEKNQGQQIISSVAMIVTLVSFTMLFATLMMGFAMFRLTSPVWPPAGMMKPSLLLPCLSTFCIFLSSVCFVWFEKNISNKKNNSKINKSENRTKQRKYAYSKH